jgi:hypothetical protein
VVDIDELLPRSRTPRDYLNLVTDPRADQEVLRALAVPAWLSGLRELGRFPVILAAVSADSRAEWELRSRPYSKGVTSVPMNLAILNGSCGRAAGATADGSPPEESPRFMVALLSQASSSLD